MSWGGIVWALVFIAAMLAVKVRLDHRVPVLITLLAGLLATVAAGFGQAALADRLAVAAWFSGALAVLLLCRRSSGSASDAVSSPRAADGSRAPQ